LRQHGTEVGALSCCAHAGPALVVVVTDDVAPDVGLSPRLADVFRATARVRSRSDRCYFFLESVQRAQEITVGFWQDVYKGDLGRVRFGVQYEFVQLDLFNGTGSVAGGLHPNNNIVFFSARYYPFN